MVEYRLNLIRDRIVPSRWRKALFLHMTLHVGACGLLLAWVKWQATRNIVRGRQNRRKAAELTRQFVQGEASAEGVFEYADLLRAGLALRAETLDEIGDALKTRPDLARIMLGLSNQLPYGVYITDFDFDSAQRQVDLQLMITEGADLAKLSISKLIERWQGDELLEGRIKSIKSVTSQTASVDERKISVWQFMCALNTGGG